MNDREKVIRGLEACRHDGCNDKSCPYARDERCVELLCYDALILLREQEPVEPDKIFTNPVCGVCRVPLDVTDYYCRHCGRAVKWRA